MRQRASWRAGGTWRCGRTRGASPATCSRWWRATWPALRTPSPRARQGRNYAYFHRGSNRVRQLSDRPVGVICSFPGGTNGGQRSANWKTRVNNPPHRIQCGVSTVYYSGSYGKFDILSTQVPEFRNCNRHLTDPPSKSAKKISFPCQLNFRWLVPEANGNYPRKVLKLSLKGDDWRALVLGARGDAGHLRGAREHRPLRLRHGQP
jgi:hypothetical protein